MKILDQTFEGEAIRIDFTEFEGCVFNNCTFIYGGQGPIVFVDCRFRNATWQFVDAAAHTLNFLQTMYHNFGEHGRQTVQSTNETLIKAEAVHKL